MIGRRLGHYEFVEKLGEGGLGEVYQARDTRLDRIVALKVLPAHLASRPESRERFEREARIIAGLNPHSPPMGDWWRSWNRLRKADVTSGC